MSKTQKAVFLVGPGYIGQCVIDRLLAEGYDVTTLVRREAAAVEFARKGVKTILGDLADGEVITKQVRASDIVIHTATADDLSSVEAIIEGIRARAAQKKHTIYIHTSGASFLCDDSKGAFKSDTIYSDKRPEQLDARPDSASHRGIDLAIIKARKDLGTQAKLFIILPPLIYGKEPQYDRLSIQIPTMCRFAIKHGYAGYIGGGKGTWSLVHVSDLARGYVTILRWLEDSPASTALEHPYFFCENGQEISWADAAAIIGQSLHSAGKVSDPVPREIPEEQWVDCFGEYSVVVIGANARNRAERIRELGWSPEHTSVRDAFEKEELPALLRETGSFAGYGRAAASGAAN